jgi:hypothetical protein
MRGRCVAAGVCRHKHRTAVARHAEARCRRGRATEPRARREAPGAVPDVFGPDQHRTPERPEGEHYQLQHIRDIDNEFLGERDYDASQDLRAEEDEAVEGGSDGAPKQVGEYEEYMHRRDEGRD